MTNPAELEAVVKELREILRTPFTSLHSQAYYEITKHVRTILSALEEGQVKTEMARSEVLHSREYISVMEAFVADIKVIVADRDRLARELEEARRQK